MILPDSFNDGRPVTPEQASASKEDIIVSLVKERSGAIVKADVIEPQADSTAPNEHAIDPSVAWTRRN